MRILAPIALFVYNRPIHTERTLNALFENKLADQSILYIFCDGRKNDETAEGIEQIEAVREICRKKKWAKEVNIIEKTDNLGLASSIINGVTEIIEKFGRIIVLEDDIVTSQGFLQYMNDALNYYALHEKIMHISGYWFPVKDSGKSLPETFFYRCSSCWGWATWLRAWQKLEKDTQQLIEKINKIPNGYRTFNLDNTYSYIGQLEANLSGKINTWAIKWYASVFLNNGLCLHPNLSLVNNIGFDNTGTHCSTTSEFDWPELTNHINIREIPIEENKTALKLIKRFYKSNRGSIVTRIRRKVGTILKQL
jgi:GR25 family glycosyltransferase involved in LPS biosynthesis